MTKGPGALQLSVFRKHFKTDGFKEVVIYGDNVCISLGEGRCVMKTRASVRGAKVWGGGYGKPDHLQS